MTKPNLALEAVYAECIAIAGDNDKLRELNALMYECSKRDQHATLLAAITTAFMRNKLPLVNLYEQLIGPWKWPREKS